MNIHTKSFITVIIVALVVIVGFFVCKPSWNKYSEAKARQAEVVQQQQALVDEEKKLDAFLAEFKSKQDLVKQVNTALPVKAVQIETVLANLDDMAIGSGVIMSDLSFSDPNAQEVPLEHAISEQDVSLTASGSFPAFENFLHLLESNLRIIDIKNLTLESGESAMTYHLDFTTYYQN